jgi:amino acid transporter
LAEQIGRILMQSANSDSSATLRRATATRVLVASSAMLAFISFWRVAAIVLNDMGSSAFYAGGISEHFVGKTAPWFILAIMLIAGTVASLYIESCGMFVRGGVYRVVKEAMGSGLAKFSVSALMFDYILTGPISGVSAGQYLVGLLNELFQFMHMKVVLPINSTAAFFAILCTLYFWWENIKGIPESSEKALRIMQVTTVMVVLMVVWCLFTLGVRGAYLPPLPSLHTITYYQGEHGGALGWLRHSSLPYTVTFIAILIGLGHSVLAMSGEETMAQVYREIEHPKLPNLKKAALVIFLYSLIFTAGATFFAVMIIPDSVRGNYQENLIGGLAMNLVGPLWLRLAFHIFVVVVGVLMLAGAVNTAIVGSNGVLNRVSEDGILPDWFRKPQRKYGTSYRILNLVVALQLFTIILSRGDVFLLGEAYAFGVMWSFSMKGLAVLVLRFTEPGKREYRVPLNLRIGKTEIPIGLGLITLTLISLCVINLFTKEVATISGLAFTVAFFAVFEISEKITKRRSHARTDLDQFNVEPGDDPTPQALRVRPGNILVAIRDPKNLYYLREVLRRTDTTKQDVVVMTARLYHREHSFSGGTVFEPSQVFDQYEQELFTAALAAAEKEGKPVSLLVVPATEVFDAIVVTAQRLESSRIVCGLSNKLNSDEQAKFTGDAWERLPEPKPRLVLEVRLPSGGSREYYLGPHTPRLREQDLDLMHRLWLEVTSDPQFAGAHHYHVVSVALEELERELHNEHRSEVLAKLSQELKKRSDGDQK